MKANRVLLTGVTGFLGSHTAIQLLKLGYEVIGTVRSKERIETIRSVIAQHTKHIDKLSFAVADLTETSIWHKLTREVDYIQHIASPFPRQMPKSEDELIAPAKDGTLAILKAAAQNQVKRVVITSSLAAVAYGTSPDQLGKRFTEEDWTDVTNRKDTTPYYRSKTIAEKAAWDFVKHDRSGMEVTTICPGAILGPVLDDDFGTSANIVLSVMNGSFPALPKIGFEIVDVRSVADLLIRAMTDAQAAGNRYIAAAEFMTLKDVALILKEHYPERKIPTAEFPNFVTRLLSVFQPVLKSVLLETIRRQIDKTRAGRELKWQPLSGREAVIACAESLVAKKIV